MSPLPLTLSVFMVAFLCVPHPQCFIRGGEDVAARWSDHKFQWAHQSGWWKESDMLLDFIDGFRYMTKPAEVFFFLKKKQVLTWSARVLFWLSQILLLGLDLNPCNYLHFTCLFTFNLTWIHDFKQAETYSNGAVCSESQRLLFHFLWGVLECLSMDTLQVSCVTHPRKQEQEVCLFVWWSSFETGFKAPFKQMQQLCDVSVRLSVSVGQQLWPLPVYFFPV